MRLRLKPEVQINEHSHIFCIESIEYRVYTIDYLVENWRLKKNQVRSFFILSFFKYRTSDSYNARFFGFFERKL